MPRAHSLFVFASLAQELTVSMLRHPSGAGEMALMDTARSFRLNNGIDAENDRNRFTPVGAIGRRVEHAHIELHVLTVIVGQFRAIGRMVEEIWWRHICAPKAPNSYLPLQTLLIT
jgi:hypothetical protein